MSTLINEDDYHIRVKDEPQAWHRQDECLDCECLTRRPDKLKLIGRKIIPAQCGWISPVTGEFFPDQEEKVFLRWGTDKKMMYAGNDYTHIQDKELIDTVVEALENAGQVAPLVYAGTLDSHKYSFFRWRTEQANGDEDGYQDQLTLFVPKASQRKIILFPSWIKGVCMNTIAPGILEAKWDLEKKQTRFARDVFLPRISAYLEERYRVSEQFHHDLEELGNVPCSLEQASFILAAFESDSGKSLTKREYNRSAAQAYLFENGIDNKGETALDLFNGVTEFYSQGDGSGKTQPPGQKWGSSEFGSAMTKKVKFFKMMHEDEEITNDHLNDLAEQGEKILMNTDPKITGVKTTVAVGAVQDDNESDW